MRALPSHAAGASAAPTGELDPYVDYGRFLTPGGGVLITYKDHDLRWRHTLWRLFAWTIATGTAIWYVLNASPVENDQINFAALLIAAVLNWIIVRKPVEIYRSAEIRPDSIVMDGTEIFWLHLMENDLPVFQEDEDGNLVLGGSYGTRFVEYLTARRFDDNDRMPEVIAAHLQEAMQQLWAPALALGKVRRGSPPGRTH